MIVTCQTHVCRLRSHGHIGQGQSSVHIVAVQERDSPVSQPEERPRMTCHNDW